MNKTNMKKAKHRNEAALKRRGEKQNHRDKARPARVKSIHALSMNDHAKREKQIAARMGKND